MCVSVHVFVQYVCCCLHAVYKIDCSLSDVLLLDARSALIDLASYLTAQFIVFSKST